MLDGQRLREYDATSGQLVRVWDLPAPQFDAALSPDGAQLAIITCIGGCSSQPGERHGALELVDLTDGKITVLTAMADPGWMPDSPAWSPDGRTLAYFALRQVRPLELRLHLMTVDVATQITSVIRDTGGSCYSTGAGPALTWSPDGTLLAVNMPTGRLDAGWDVATVHPDGSARRPLPGSSPEPWLDWRAAS